MPVIGNICLRPLWLAFFLFSCERSIDLSLEFKVHDHQGKALQGTKILINNQIVCETTEAGFCAAAVSVPSKRKFSVQALKDTASEYFAPYNAQFEAEAARLGKFPIAITLYSLPKSEVEDSQLAAEPILEVAAPHHSELDKSASKVNLAESSLSDEIPIPETAPEVPTAETLAESTFEDQNSETSAIDSVVKKEEKKPLRITIQTLANNKPLDGVHIYFETDSNIEHKSFCKTNARGRCSAEVTRASVDGLYRFYARKDGYLSLSLQSRLSERLILRFHLHEGPGLDLRVSERAYDERSPVAQASVLFAGRKIGVTDRNGFFSFPMRQLGASGGELTIDTPRSLPQRTIVKITDTSLDLRKSILLNPLKPSRVRIALIFEGINTPRDNLIKSSLRRALLQRQAMVEIPEAIIKRRTGANNLGVFVENGWVQDENIAGIDSLIYFEKLNQTLKATVIGPKGEKLVSSETDFSEKDMSDSFNLKVQKMATAIYEGFPFELSLIAEPDTKVFYINGGSKHGLELKAGEVLTAISSNKGLGPIKLKIEEVGLELSKVKAVDAVESNELSQGMSVVLSGRVLDKISIKQKGPRVSNFSTQIKSAATGKEVSR